MSKVQLRDLIDTNYPFENYPENMRLLKYLTVLMLLASAKCVFSQSVYPSDTVSLATNNIHLNLINGGYFLDHRNGQLPLRIKEGDVVIPGIKALSLWMIGMDAGYNIRGKAQKGFGMDTTSFVPGPLLSIPNEINLSNNFNRFWRSSAYDIGVFRGDYYDNQVFDNPIPESILGWPATGNPFFEGVHGFELPENEFGYAPFFDKNGDSVYNPEDGDYPCIAGDEGVWWVFNDHSELNPEGFPFNLGLEIKAEASTHDLPGVLGNTVFFHFSFMNKNLFSLKNLQIGLFVDGLLGCSTNNRVASLPEEDIFIIYNAVPDDEFCESEISFPENPGVIAVKTIYPPLLEDGSFSPMKSFMYLRPEGDTIMPLGARWPENAWESYQYLNSSWRDGSHLYLGGNGYQLGTEIADHAFDGTLLPGGTDLWYDEQINSPVGIMGYEGVQLHPGEANRVAFAISWIEGEFDITNESDKARVVDSMFQTYLYYFEGGDFYYNPHFCVQPIILNEQAPEVQSDLVVYPNPANSVVNVILKRGNEVINSIELFDPIGRSVLKRKNIDKRHLELEGNDLPAGIYFLKIATSKGKTHVSSLSFQH
ncbi:MAG: T9SS C-terminal target domain-containing protein [Bacteroidetes bacterium]|nr:MAG: T9SS C-terminal target domain-containing protein [Bacteroidota bacterium]